MNSSTASSIETTIKKPHMDKNANKKQKKKKTHIFLYMTKFPMCISVGNRKRESVEYGELLTGIFVVER